MTKKALLIGCNYPGSNAELKGCVNDVMTMKEILTTVKGFSESDITILIDTDSKFTSPTGANIRKALDSMIPMVSSGDVLFVHFSGHGTQITSMDEKDWKNEALCPTDMNLIPDDDLKEWTSKLPQGLHLTVVTDCCHSGGMLDHTEITISGDKSGNPIASSPDFNNRSLPASDVAAMLSKMLGQNVESNALRAALGKAFGSDASPYAAGIMKAVESMVPQEHQATVRGLLRFLPCFSGMTGGSKPTATASTTAPANMASSSQAGMGGNGGVMGMLGNIMKPPAPPKVGDDVGILITGCQSNETSADVREGSTAYGALTNAIKTCLAQDPSLSHRQLVTNVRAHLRQGGFSQNPCLECSEANADTPFIC
uniref:Peptidase C14 caspase domain-containing protein n=2 Tax=Compsopogon caeruleus TaxID=31354 RepID=A0A7S1XHI8_9RHOD|mmetsp:Transcript_9008/g.18173  ORF Transcript_9008/g.18173 Transcript_9008/m.18173 type:complete len:369 (+) Transcript_9008:218-1324(+)|eukprot:CAMPEP_0184678818 /NCGR_PEP_ID=MMETSP0312-20130426/1611_1 /TAXON_ID=31354 /ORGANISM="Compsopogon coeruleus, Strain SAG 36.94" /LENGTH=368 /DNA_ID=CAMNT_0027127845 /DNA_START=170 /DNA_END=1276 /DNA_ORIENTATION=-